MDRFHAPGWLLGLVIVALATSCSTGATSTPSASASAVAQASPSPVPSADVKRWIADSTAFADQFNSEYRDAAAAFADFTDDSRILDPTNADFEISPKSEILSSWQGFVAAFPEYAATTIATYVSAGGAAITTDVAGLRSPEAPPGGPVREMRIFRFTGTPGTKVTTLELWYRLDEVEASSSNCFALHDCGPALQAFIQRYASVWSSGSGSAIAALYRADATFSDSALGIQEAGPVRIGALRDARFGTSAPNCSVGDVYVQTLDGDPNVTDNTNPDGGKVLGVALTMKCEVGSGASQQTAESVAVLLFGTRKSKTFDLDPNGLIVSEEVFHTASAPGVADVAH